MFLNTARQGFKKETTLWICELSVKTRQQLYE